MSSVKGIKQRIANVSTTKQIMKAMDMVAFTKLQKARKRVETARPIHRHTKRIVQEFGNSEYGEESGFVTGRDVKNTAYIIITSDKGLCGSYNVNVCEAALAHMKQGKNEQILVIGSKGNEYFKRRNKNIMSRVIDQSEARMYWDSQLMSELIASLYMAGDVDEVFLAYTYFESTLNYIPRVERLLPIPEEEDGMQHGEMDYEPDIPSFMEQAVPLYLHMYLFAAMAESVACEHASRMVNMDTASKNASEIIDDLNRLYNRKRQAAITQELNEIVGGANILK